jgi:hypothetical protein
MALKDRLRLAHDESDGVVTLHIFRRCRGVGRPARLLPFTRVRRSELRELCDVLHDYADALDRKDRDS